jgi:DNA-binding transcriptional ArsR family regulator
VDVMMTSPDPSNSDHAAAPHDHANLPPLPRVRLEDYAAAGDLLRALAAPIRLAIIDLLTDADRCVHELVDALGAPQPLVSQHLKTLRAARLVATRRRGREMVYRLADEHVATIARDTLAHAREEEHRG